MAKYEFTAIKKGGSSITGTLEAADRLTAINNEHEAKRSLLSRNEVQRAFTKRSVVHFRETK